MEKQNKISIRRRILLIILAAVVVAMGAMFIIGYQRSQSSISEVNLGDKQAKLDMEKGDISLYENVIQEYNNGNVSLSYLFGYISWFYHLHGNYYDDYFEDDMVIAEYENLTQSYFKSVGLSSDLRAGGIMVGSCALIAFILTLIVPKFMRGRKKAD